MYKFVSRFFYMFALWYMLSANNEVFFIMSGIIVAAIVTSATINYLPEYHTKVKILPACRYLVSLFLDIITSGISVMKSIWTMADETQSGTIQVPLSDQDILHSVIYGNSMTITPGTYTIDIKRDYLLIHALDKRGNEELISGQLDQDVGEILIRHA